MKKPYSIILLLFVILFISCESKQPEPVTFDSFFDKKYNSYPIIGINKYMRVSIEGYLAIQSSISLRTDYLNLILFEEPDKQGTYLATNIKIGTEANQAEKLPRYYSDKDLKIHTNENEIIDTTKRVKITGKRYFHDKKNRATYYIMIDTVEKVQ